MRQKSPSSSAIANTPTASDYAQRYILAIGLATGLATGCTIIIGCLAIIGGLALPVRSPTFRPQPTMLSAVFWPSAATANYLRSGQP